ncbi:MAG: primase C-terminal domain-containing protein, partial [Bacteroidetes bacterium]|nr:primase C-terminal domain-containing protein [Bacteroidota bacterium]
MEQNNTNHNLDAKNDLTHASGITAFIGKRIKESGHPMRPIPLMEVIRLIQTSKEIKHNIETLRTIPDNEQQQGFKKDNLPYFTLGEFSENKLLKSNFIRTKYLILDYDHLGEQLSYTRTVLRADPFVFSLFTSPRADGVKVIIELQEYVNNLEEYNEALTYAAEKFQKLYGITFDPASKGAARACYLSYDPNLFLNIGAEKLEIPRRKDTYPRDGVELADKFEFRGVGKGGRQSALSALLGKFIQQGWHKDHSIELLRLWNQQNIPPLDERELLQQIESHYTKYADPVRRLPVKFYAKDNCYVRLMDKGK